MSEPEARKFIDRILAKSAEMLICLRFRRAMISERIFEARFTMADLTFSPEILRGSSFAPFDANRASFFIGSESNKVNERPNMAMSAHKSKTDPLTKYFTIVVPSASFSSYKVL